MRSELEPPQHNRYSQFPKSSDNKSYSEINKRKNSRSRLHAPVSEELDEDIQEVQWRIDQEYQRKLKEVNDEAMSKLHSLKKDH